MYKKIMRSVREEVYNRGPTDQRPTTDDLTFGKISNGDISVAYHAIYPVFGCRMGFSGLADRMALIPV